MSEDVMPNAPGKSKKVLLQLLLGAVSGAAGMIAVLELLGEQNDFFDRPERVFAIGTALIYGLMAAFVGLGVLAPAVGARTLNVEDRQELAEQRSILLTSSLGCALIAAFLAFLTLAGSVGKPGTLSAAQAAAGAAVTGLALLVSTIVYRNQGDEMMQAAARDAAALTTSLLFLVFGTWAAAAHLGFAPMFDPLLFVSGVFALYLLAVFVAVGKRGLLKPR